MSPTKVFFHNLLNTMTRARNWCFTINNPENNIELSADEIERFHIRYLVWQKEQGEQNTEHIQGYIEFSKVKRMSALKKMGFLNKGHFERRRGTRAQARDYCMKEDTRIEGPFEIGEFVVQGKRSDLIEVKDDMLGGMTVDEAVEQHTATYARYPKLITKCREIYTKRRAIKQYQKRSKKKVIALIGPTGTGKTSHVYKKYDAEDIYHYRQTNTNTVWFNGYDGQKVILIDDYYGSWKWTFLLNILDIYPTQVEIKGGFVWLNWERIYITSNTMPNNWYRRTDSIDPLLRRINKIKIFDGDDN